MRAEMRGCHCMNLHVPSTGDSSALYMALSMLSQLYIALSQTHVLHCCASCARKQQPVAKSSEMTYEGLLLSSAAAP